MHGISQGVCLAGPMNLGIPQFTTLIHSSKTARKAKTHKTKINFPLLPEKRRLVYERKEPYKRKLARKLKNRY
jgi:hypothetical protein